MGKRIFDNPGEGKLSGHEVASNASASQTIEQFSTSMETFEPDILKYWPYGPETEYSVCGSTMNLKELGFLHDRSMERLRHEALDAVSWAMWYTMCAWCDWSNWQRQEAFAQYRLLHSGYSEKIPYADVKDKVKTSLADAHATIAADKKEYGRRYMKNVLCLHGNEPEKLAKLYRGNWKKYGRTHVIVPPLAKIDDKQTLRAVYMLTTGSFENMC
jgi:hypothetical protein